MTVDNYSYRRPFSYGEIWSASFRLAWKRPSLWLWGFFVTGGPIQLFQMFAHGPWYDSGVRMLEHGLSGFLIYITVVIVFFLAMDSFFSPMLIHSVTEIESRGDYDLGNSLGEGAANWGWFMAHTLLTFSAMAVVILGVVLLGGALSLISNWLTVLAMIVLVPATIVVMLGFSFVVVYARRIVVIERLGFIGSIHAGYVFLMNNKAPTAVIAFTLAGALFVLGMVLGGAMLISAFSSGSLPGLGDYEPTTPGLGTWIIGIVDVVTSAIAGTIMTNLFTLLYLRLRPQGA